MGIPIQTISFSPGGKFALMATLVDLGGGSSCPLGAKFILPAEQLPALRDEYQARLSAAQDRNALVQQILSNDPALPSESNDFHAHQVVYSPNRQRIKLAASTIAPYVDSSGIRPTGETSIFGTPRYTRPRQLMLEAGTNCGVGDENRFEILGFSLNGEFALLENLTTHWDANGPSPECTEEAKFLISVDHLQQEFLVTRSFSNLLRSIF